MDAWPKPRSSSLSVPSLPSFTSMGCLQRKPLRERPCVVRASEFLSGGSQSGSAFSVKAPSSHALEESLALPDEVVFSVWACVRVKLSVLCGRRKRLFCESA